MAENPLKQLESAAKGAIRSVVNFAMDGTNGWGSLQRGKTDSIFGRQPMDVLRRAAFHNVFDTLFLKLDDFHFVVADKTLQKVIGKLADNVFPRGTVFTHEDKGTNELLLDIIRQTKFDLKSEKIVTESSLMGYCGLRSVYDTLLGRWLLEVKQKEYLIIETVEGVPDEIVALGVEWPVERKEGGRTYIYWKKERWTNETYEFWPEKREGPHGKPKFLPGEATTEPSVYGEIPITLVPHFFDSGCHGTGVVSEDEILTVKNLLRLHHKRHFGHLKYMDPNPVIKNRADKGQPLDMGIGKVIDLENFDEKLPVDIQLLEFAGMPESVKDEFYHHVKALYDAAGLKAPPLEQIEKPGTNNSGVALRLIDKDDAKTIESLRDNGYSQVVRHFEKILRMGANMSLPEYSGITLDNPESWTVTAKFPAFFPPTDEEIGLKLSNMRQAKLPPEIMGPMVAALFGIEDEKATQQIIENLKEQAELEKPTALGAFGGGA